MNSQNFKLKGLIISAFFFINLIVHAGVAIDRAWVTSGSYRGENGIFVHCDLNYNTLKKDAYWIVVYYFDANGNYIKEWTSNPPQMRRGSGKYPVISSAGLSTLLPASDYKDYQIFMPYRRLSESSTNQGYCVIYICTDGNAQNSIDKYTSELIYVR